MQRDSLDTARLRAALPPRWTDVQVVDETASTNADLLGAAASGAPAGTVLVAEHQIAGRGRLERTWTSPPRAGLTFSVLLRPGVPVSRWGWLPLLSGVAVREAVGSAAGVATALKWPNDLLAADGRKLAGILAQTAGGAVALGIGLNVSTTADELPVPTATSLVLAGAVDVDRTALLVAILGALDDWYSRWAEVGGDAQACGLVTAYRAGSATIGSRVRVDLGPGDAVVGETVVGEAVGVDELGRLVLLAADGRRVINAGDVHHLRSP